MKLRKTAGAAAVALLLLVVAGCGSKPATEATTPTTAGETSRVPGPDDVKMLTDENPTSAVSVWGGWAIVRDPVSESGDMCAQLLRWDNGKWKFVANSTEGLYLAGHVRPHIPDLTPEGMTALGLIEE